MTAITKTFTTTTDVEITAKDLNIDTDSNNRAVVNIFIAQGNDTQVNKTIQIKESLEGTYRTIYTFGGVAYTPINVKNLMLKEGCYIKIASAGSATLTGAITGFSETDE